MQQVNGILELLKLDKHPDKTFIGRISRRFDFLGYRFYSSGLVGVAAKTIERFAERVSRLYEQGADLGRIGVYVERWFRWVRSGVDVLCAMVGVEHPGLIVTCGFLFAVLKISTQKLPLIHPGFFICWDVE